MTYELTVEEKLSIIQSQLRNIKYKKYNAEVELIAENALDTPNTGRIAEINATIANCDSQITALNAEKESVQAI